MIELYRFPLKDRRGEAEFSIRLLHEFGTRDDYLDARKVSDIWEQARKHDVLFSDYTAGKAEPFLIALFNPNSVWIEIVRDEESVGVAYITHVVPKFDAKGHFAVWDKVAGGREKIFWMIMSWLFRRYQLHRISAETPRYQSGTMRFLRRLGFVHEGQVREAVIHKGVWMPLETFGITISEFTSLMKEKFQNE